MQEKTVCVFLALFNRLAMAVFFFLQFHWRDGLTQRVFANINWSMLLHRRVGKWLAIIFCCTRC